MVNAAENGAPDAPAAYTANPADGVPLRPAEELDNLLAPIALYPDALIALILPAATMSPDVVRAAAYLKANRDLSQVSQQPWDGSVQALAHYPDIVQWMSDNIEWTQQTGDAFTVQPADVMKSIQQLRARAIAAGTLVSTPEQTVLTDGGEIRIVPAQPEVIYVPRYDSEVVYDDSARYSGSALSFGAGFAMGSWLAYDLNWDTYGIWVGTWHPRYDYRHPAWRHPIYGRPIIGHPWQPVRLPPRRPVWPVDPNRHRPPIIRPVPFPGTPGRPPGFVPHPPSNGRYDGRYDGRNGPPVQPGNPPVNYRPNPRGYPPPSDVGPRPAPPPGTPGPDPRTPTPRPRVDPTPGRPPETDANRPHLNPRNPDPDSRRTPTPVREGEPRGRDRTAPPPAERPAAAPANPVSLPPPPVTLPRPPVTLPPPPIRTPPVPARVAPATPTLPSPPPASPPPNVFNGYHRGSDTRDASERGQSSRHSEPPAQRAAPPPPPPVRPPPAPPPAATPATNQTQPDQNQNQGNRGRRN